MKKIIKNKLRIISAIFAIIAIPFFSGCGSSSSSKYLVNLEMWGPIDDSSVYTEIINQYKTMNPYIGEIKYKKFSQETYKQELIDALAGGHGPDIFLINNSWFPYFEDKIYPAPDTFISERDMQINFPDVVSSDFVDNGKIYAVPLSVDSLQMYYNEDMFNAAGIAYPPKTWQEFQDDVKKLTSVDSYGKIIKSGAAIGTAKNVNRFSDILSALLFQAGAKMPLKKGEVIDFDEGVVTSNGNIVQAGEQALGFYTQFSKLAAVDNEASSFYTWNSEQDNSLSAFAAGSVGMTFNYSWQNDKIKSKNPKLNYSIAAIPQMYVDKPATVANYWGYAVSSNKIAVASTTSKQAAQPAVSNDVRAREAWQFLRFLTLKNSGTVTLYNSVTGNKKDFSINFDPAANYLTATKQPAARRDIIESQKSDVLLGTFAVGNLIAKHWYQVDPDKEDIIFSDMIEAINSSKMSLHESLSLAKNRINRLSEN